jgi:LDH2 family malate/lactate/ureidoglycolate dehydrogenase
MFTQLSARRSISHFFVALDPARFLPDAQFPTRLQEMVNHVRDLPPLLEGQPVMVPGDPEKRSAKRRAIEGIPVEDPKYDEFLAVNPSFAGTLKT